jgi:hypothetical protein
MKINGPDVLNNTLEPTSKRVLVRPCAADKGKGKNIIIDDPYITQSGYSKGSGQKKYRDARGQARSNTRSRSPVLRMPDGLGTKTELSETSTKQFGYEGRTVRE